MKHLTQSRGFLYSCFPWTMGKKLII